MKPNLFDYATKELSQDAFICWLCAWAAPILRDENPFMHACGSRFLRSLLEWDDSRVIKTVQVIRQKMHIDVLVLVNEGEEDSCYLLVEDKVDSSESKGQLKKYVRALDEMERLAKFAEKRLVFLKTGNQSYYGAVTDDGFSVFGREQFLRVLYECKAEGGSYAIFDDFVEYLERMDADYRQWESIPLAGWRDPNRRTGRLWKGFYANLQREMGGGDYVYVPNKVGGFECFYFGGNPYSSDIEKETYFQTDEAADPVLYFRVSGKDKSATAALQRDLAKVLVGKVASDDYPELVFVKARTQPGKSMRVAVVKGIFSVKNGFVDVEETAQRMKSVQRKAREYLN